jgi:leader peptidase (prepilin peptidase) / N-methyltransferase
MINITECVMFFETHLLLYYCFVAIVGVCVGSFLNVVIYRYPKILAKVWREQCYEYLKMTVSEFEESNLKVMSLSQPASHCPHCQKSLKWYDNIPLLSFLYLRARCRNCQAAISGRYFLIEGITLCLSVLVVYQLGVSLQALFALILIWFLIAMSTIDIEHQILPDTMTLSMLWLGLLVNSFELYMPLQDAVFGAIAGYLFLYAVATIFKYLRKREGMGQGDFKLLACFGAWLGWQALPVLILIASVTALMVSFILYCLKRQSFQAAIPFGPYLALAGFVCLLWDQPLMFLG